jgi:general secretion pathway protein A
VDEAHHLSADILEEVRLLTNLETANDKLLQVLLVGQPELDQKLDSVGLRQLKQRIALRSHLEPLNQKETKEYVERRLHVAGANSSATALFPAETMAALYRYSRGTPRLINTICDHALLIAYTRQMRCVTREIIEAIVEDLRLDVVGLPEIERVQGGEGDEVRRAARVLLELYASLKSKARDEELETLASKRFP